MSIQKFLINYAILIALFFALSIPLGTNDVKQSFVLLTIVCFIESVVAGKLFFNGNKSLQYILILAFIIKVAIGIAHYLIFFDSNYFSGNGEILGSLQNDFTAYFYYVEKLIDNKHLDGILAFDNSVQEVSHQSLLNVIATCMFSFGANAMNIVPLNSMFSNLGAINMVLIISRYWEDKEKMQADAVKGLLFLLVLFPTMLDDALFVRDITGQFIMTIAAAMLFLSNSRWQLILLIPAAYLMSLQRDAYMIAVFVTFLYMRYVYGQSRNIFSMVTAAVVCIVAMNIFQGSEDNIKTAGVADNVGLLPLRFFMALVGPFPWIQFLKAFVTPSFASQLYQYILGIIHVACLYLVIFRKGYNSPIWKSPVAILGLILFAFGVLNHHMHITYVAAGTYFLVPLIYLQYRGTEYDRAIKIAFVFLVCLNIFMIAVGGLGLKTVV